MTNNLQNIFDAVVGYDGSAVSDYYKSGKNADQEILDEIHGQADNFYKSVTNEEADKILKAVREYENADNQNDKYYVRDGLDD